MSLSSTRTYMRYTVKKIIIPIKMNRQNIGLIRGLMLWYRDNTLLVLHSLTLDIKQGYLVKFFYDDVKWILRMWYDMIYLNRMPWNSLNIKINFDTYI